MILTNRTVRFVAMTASLVVLLGCDTTSGPAAPEPFRPSQSPPLLNALVGPQMGNSIADRFRALGREAPGFTGVFFDEGGNLTVSVATDSFSDQSLQRVLAWARFYSASASTRRTAQLRRVEFDYSTLDNNFASVLGAILPQDGLNTAYIDETKGRIVLGFESLNSIPRLQERLTELGVPQRMVVVEQRQPAVPETTLSQVYRPSVGGLRIMTPGNPGPQSCSLGFNTWRRGADGYTPGPSLGNFFITASHCSATRGQFSGNPYYQDSTQSGKRIGAEVQVAPILYWPDSRCVTAQTSPCQVADVLVVRYDDTVSVLYGNVAHVNSSKTILGYYNVQGYTLGGLNGEQVTKVGYKTGETTGNISATCVHKFLYDPYSGNDIWLICEQEANYSSGAGDSGAPVFIPYNINNWNTPRMVGVHSSAEGNKKYFAPIDRIDYALNSLYYWF